MRKEERDKRGVERRDKGEGMRDWKGRERD